MSVPSLIASQMVRRRTGFDINILLYTLCIINHDGPGELYICASCSATAMRLPAA